MSFTRSTLLLLNLFLFSSLLLAVPRPEAISIVRSYESRPGVRATILVRDLETGETVLSHRSNETFRPASLVKIATTGAFLALRGRDYRFRLPIALRGELIDSVWQGDIVLGASADPSIGSHYIANGGRLIRQVKDLLLARGISHVSGSLLIDMAGYPPPFYSEHWPDEDLDYYYAVPVSGFSLADNYADLYLFNEGEGFGIDLQIAGLTLPYQKVYTSGSSNRLKLLLQPRLDSLMIGGSVNTRTPGAYLRHPISDPPSFAAYWLAEGLRRSGITLDGDPSVVYGTEPIGGLDTLGFYSSLPADTLAKITNFRSANGYAEALAYALNEPAERASGKPWGVRRFWQERLGLTREAFHPEDGSGLSPTGGLTAEALSLILSDLWHDRSVRRPFLSSLPQAGSEGTVRSLEVPSDIKAYLKSGSMRGVRGYAGYVQQGEKWYSIVYIANGQIQPAEARSTFSRLLTGLFSEKPVAPPSETKRVSRRAKVSSSKTAKKSPTKRKARARK